MAVVSGVLAALLTFSAVRKLSHAPDVVESYARAGVREQWLNPLAIVLLAGAAGLVAGIFWEPLGIAAAGAFVAYFAVACSFHLRNGDAAHLPTPLLMLALAAAALALS
jgi:DoxX-like family